MRMLFVFCFLLIAVSYHKDLFAWLQIFQLKEYRRSKYKEYLFSQGGKKALFNKKQLLRLALLVVYLASVGGSPGEGLGIGFSCFIGRVLIESVNIVAGIRRGFVLPQFTNRLFVTFLFAELVVVLLLIFFSKSVGWPGFLFFQFILPFFVGLLSFVFQPVDRFMTKKLTGQARSVLAGNGSQQVVAISGSYGKSTIKNFLTTMLSTSYSVQRTEGNINTVKGIAHFLLNDLDNDTDRFVCEMGGDTPGEIGTIGSMVQHKVGILAGLNNQHAGLYGGLAGAVSSEAEILNHLEEVQGLLYVNADSDHLSLIDFPIKVTVVKYSIVDPKTEAYTKIIGIEKGIWRCQLSYKGETYDFETDVTGRHNILNLTGAIIFCLDHGVDQSGLFESVRNISKDQKTMKSFSVGQSTVIDDTYNINVDGVVAACQLLRDSGPHDHRVVVINEINELGDEAEETHRRLGHILAESDVDFIYLTGQNYTHFVSEGLAGTSKTVVDCYAVGSQKSFDMLEELTRTNSLFIFLGREQGSMKFLDRLRG